MYKKLLGVAAGVGMLFVAGVAFADTATINFEPATYTVGDINGQDGWSKTGSFDVAVVSNTYSIPAFGTQVLRLSDAITSGSFGDQTFSKSLTNSAGETAAENGLYAGGTRQSHFEAQFDFASTMATEQSGMHMSVSPDRGDGARMSYLRFEDKADGIHVFFDDYKDGLVEAAGTCVTGDNFTDTDIATIDRTNKHTIKFVMDFVNGPNNDVVKIYIDGVLKITGTSWEGYFNYCEGNPTRTVDSLLFRESGTAHSGNAGNGFLVDNVSLASSIPTVHVTIAKYVDGVHATAVNANNESFTQQATYSFSNDTYPSGISGSDPYSIGPVGNNTPTAYEAKTLEFYPGASYGTSETVPSSNVGADCSSGKPYTLAGYSVGADEAAAQAASKSMTAPSFTNLQSNQFVIVWNTKCPVLGSVSGLKFWDVNGNGVKNPGEPGLSGWTFNLNGPTTGNQVTASNGAYTFSNVLAGAYTVTENAQSGWTQTTATPSFTLAAGENKTDVNIGNACFVSTGGNGKGFWTNKNGEALVNVGGVASELNALTTANLRNANGSAFDPLTYAAYKTWNTNATAVNMAYMLSAQLSAVILSKEEGLLNYSKQVVITDPALASVPGMSSLGVIAIGDLVAAANTEVGANGNTPAGNPNRSYQEALKNALEKVAEGNKVQLCQPYTAIKTFTASNSSYYNGPTNASPLYANGPFSVTWDPSSGAVTGGYYTEQSPANTGTIYYNNIVGGTVSGNNFSLNFSRTNPNSYSFTANLTLSGSTLSGTMDGSFLFTATGVVTP